jgi:hypothetical protein
MAVNQNSVDNVLKNLNETIREIEDKSVIGIKRALMFIEKQAVKRTPVDTGNLRNSFYKKTLKLLGGKPAGEIGNTAEYAIYVHENLESHHRVGEAKFLENAIIENSDRIVKIIAENINTRMLRK